MLINPNTDYGAHVLRRLNDEQVIWLTTVGADGTPQPNPVWFVWESETFLVYTQPSTHRLKHIAHNPKVALHFDGGERGEDVVVFTGEAQIDTNAPPADAHAAYLEKYRDGIDRLDTTPESFAQTYSVALRIIPKKLRGF
jgi:PPOX class probable F420-dependent enzyme